ncbi:hypothetical protein PPACK8108_LOCUS3550 [Phakopsora pachyrhizi]|uniref:Uncharacterized protein n=1 Tax=Phakopsora pachyrhizi TaxID=170000 RepID=A0AAV0AK82_PHAPC|nr:hypothetical protein PPACK8108_LOCUS3550 [Phakopsora pachyrhizi]
MSSQKAFYLPQRNKAIIDFVVNMEQNKKASTLASASINTLKFSRSPIHDVSLLLISPEMIRFGSSILITLFLNMKVNLSSSALSKGLSLALERKFSKSPCRTPPSRRTASETNLSVPAANFSHLQALSNSGSALSERAFDDSENLSTKGENQNLSRKSRIKRQVSATIDPTQAGTYQQWSSMISLRDGYTSASKTNNFEADSIRALQETNVAIQKATSKRLSTLVFQKPVSIHLKTALVELSGKEENYTYQHCLASSVNQQQILDKISAPLIKKSSRSPNARISLLTGNGKDDMNSKPFPSQSEPEDEVMSGAAVDDFKFDKDQPI